MREVIRSGIPWRPLPAGVQCKGYADLIFLVTGLFYPVTDFIRAKDDVEPQIEIWSALREDILAKHMNLQPLSRPAAWWRLEDREPHYEGEDEVEYFERLNLLSGREQELGRNKIGNV